MKPVLALPLFLSVLLGGCSKRQKIDIYVTPFYNSSPLQINIGEYSRQLKTNSPRKMLRLAEEIRQRVDEVNAMTLFVLAIRLYDVGEKDAAVYWFYNAQFRKRVFLEMAIGLDPTGAPAALGAFQELSGRWINGYAFGNPDKLVATLNKVCGDVEHMGYVANAYPGYDFRPASEQQAIVDAQLKGLRESLINHIIENKEDILRQRKENGIEGKY